MIKVENEKIELNGTSKDIIIETSILIDQLYDELGVIEQYMLTDMIIDSIACGRKRARKRNNENE